MDKNKKLQAMIQLYKALSPEHQKTLKDFCNSFQRLLDKEKATSEHLRSQLINLRNFPY